MPEPERGSRRGEPEGSGNGRAVRIELAGAPPFSKHDVFLDGRVEVYSSHGVRGVERAVLSNLDVEIAGRVLVVGSREAVAAVAVARLRSGADVSWLTFDAYELHRAWEVHRAALPPNLSLGLAPDLPRDGTFDWVVLPLAQTQDSALSAELIRAAVGALARRGKILAVTDNPRDQWVHKRVVEVFGAATIHRKDRQGAAYVARPQPGRKERERSTRKRFPVRVFGQELEIETRAGVFAHGRLDDGAFALSEVAPLESGSRVLDLGCGSGVLGIAAALAAPDGRAVLVDSNVRAVRCARENARRADVDDRTTVILAHDLSSLRGSRFDIVLANPPYFSDHRITGQFVDDGYRALVPGGRFLLVTKTPEHPRELIRGRFGDCETVSRRGYAVLEAIKLPD